MYQKSFDQSDFYIIVVQEISTKNNIFLRLLNYSHTITILLVTPPLIGILLVGENIFRALMFEHELAVHLTIFS